MRKSKYTALKEEVYEANMLLPKHGLVLFTFGNVSAVDKELGVFAIKPSGVPYEQLKADDIVVLDFELNKVEGALNPSSDTKTHLVLYQEFKEIGAIVHTHSTYSVAWAQAFKPIPVLGTTHADHVAGEIPCTEVMTDKAIKGDYEVETGLQITNLFRQFNYQETEMVLVGGHGPFTWGKTAEKAVYNSVVMEELARMAYLTLQINPEVTPLKQALVDKHYFRKHGANAYYGQKKNLS